MTTGVRVTAEGELQVLHSGTGAYVPAITLLQVDRGILSALVPDQAALLTDIRDATAYLQLIETLLTSVKSELVTTGEKVTQSNKLLAPLTQIHTALGTVNQAIDSLESFGEESNILLTAIKNEIAQVLGRLPTVLGASSSSNSLSVALATDSTIYSFLTNLLATLSDGGVNSALSYLSTISEAQFWKAPVSVNTTSPIINAAATAASSALYTLNSQTEALHIQNFFSAVNLSAQFAIELQVASNTASLSDKTYYYRGDVASPYLASAGVYPGESPIIIPVYGYAQFTVHLSAISGGGNVTTYAKEIK